MGLALIAIGVVGCVLASTRAPLETVFAFIGFGAGAVLWTGGWSWSWPAGSPSASQVLGDWQA